MTRTSTSTKFRHICQSARRESESGCISPYRDDFTEPVQHIAVVPTVEQLLDLRRGDIARGSIRFEASSTACRLCSFDGEPASCKVCQLEVPVCVRGLWKQHKPASSIDEILDIVSMLTVP